MMGKIRIIPAHAGQTIVPQCPRTMSPDHPRACGANGGNDASSEADFGSSPRMRGKHRHHHRHGQPRRIIPAHAGQTHLLAMFFTLRSDHPRACGANTATTIFTSVRDGSSPRMRGKPDGVEDVADRGRIIPAHAGQTMYSSPLDR